MLLCLLATAAAGPWVKDAGQHYVKVSGNRFVAGEYVDPQVQDAEGLAYSSWSAVLYAEVGLAPGLMLHANLPYLWAANEDLESGWQYRQRGGGDALLGVDWQLPVEIPVSLFVQARVPLYADGDRPALYPAMGDPNVDLDLQANVGHSAKVGPGYLWGVAEGGFRYRSGWTTPGNTVPFDYQNGLPYRGQVGYAPIFRDKPLGWVQLELSGLVNPGSDAVTRQWHQVGAGVAVSVDSHTHVELGVQRIYAARSASLGDMLSLGISHQR